MVLGIEPKGTLSLNYNLAFFILRQGFTKLVECPQIRNPYASATQVAGITGGCWLCICKYLEKKNQYF